MNTADNFCSIRSSSARHLNVEQNGAYFAGVRFEYINCLFAIPGDEYTETVFLEHYGKKCANTGFVICEKNSPLSIDGLRAGLL